MQELGGLTTTERRLHQLCANSFLRLWTYGNVYRDQAIGGGNSQGKEICDALIVFKDKVIIFSDKECALSDHQDLRVSWERWYKHAILKSQRQLLGAERWLRNHAYRVFQDISCTERVTALPTNWEETKVYKIVIANGISDAIQNHFNDSGSLVLEHAGTSRFEYSLSDLASDPFTIKTSASDRDVFHIFDEYNLATILSSLDTISDFARYLDKREGLYRSGKSFFAPGEEELLAYYLQHLDETGQHDFAFDNDYDAIMFESGLWGEFEDSQHHRSSQLANQQSYLWDEIIETASHDLVSGLLRYPISEGLSVETRILEQLASENRFKRRILSGMLWEVMSRPEVDLGFFARTLRPESSGDVFYLLLSVARPPEADTEEYREVRTNLLFEYCRAVRNHYHYATDIYGIATELNSSSLRSWDLCYFDGSTFSDQDAKESTAFSDEFGVYRHFSTHHGHFMEYPSEGSESRSQLGLRSAKGRHRNLPCACGSGRKYKHCCGRINSPSKLEWLTLPDE